MTFEELVRARINKRAVTHPNWKHPKAAAFVINMPGSTLVNLLPRLKLYESKPKPKKKGPEWFKSREEIEKRSRQ
jgi:hypothetical protein